jgi:hypothetical protein
MTIKELNDLICSGDTIVVKPKGNRLKSVWGKPSTRFLECLLLH